MARALLGSAVVLALVSLAAQGFSQSEPPPTAAYPEPAPAEAAPVAPAAAGPVAPAPAATPAAPAIAPPPSAPPPSAPPATAQSRASSDSSDGYDVSHAGIVEPVAPPPEPGEKEGFKVPDFSVRVDPLNWIIAGRLGLELELAVWKFISVEMVPVFVTSEQPPYMNLGQLPATLHQKSNGIGAMSGASIGAGFWLNGKPFKGTVLRAYLTNYGYRYVSIADSNGAEIDNVTHTERHFGVMIGDHMKWGPFTIASGFGLGVELNRERRCVDATTASTPTRLAFTSNCPKDIYQMQITNTNPPGTTNLNGFLHPVYVDFRISLGFVF
jgi:hypothetical protein